jgi:hypothetical protein
VSQKWSDEQRKPIPHESVDAQVGKNEHSGGRAQETQALEKASAKHTPDTHVPLQQQGTGKDASSHRYREDRITAAGKRGVEVGTHTDELDSDAQAREAAQMEGALLEVGLDEGKQIEEPITEAQRGDRATQVGEVDAYMKQKTQVGAQVSKNVQATDAHDIRGTGDTASVKEPVYQDVGFPKAPTQRSNSKGGDEHSSAARADFDEIGSQGRETAAQFETTGIAKVPMPEDKIEARSGMCSTADDSRPKSKDSDNSHEGDAHGCAARTASGDASTASGDDTETTQGERTSTSSSHSASEPDFPSTVQSTGEDRDVAAPMLVNSNASQSEVLADSHESSGMSDSTKMNNGADVAPESKHAKEGADLTNVSTQDDVQAGVSAFKQKSEPISDVPDPNSMAVGLLRDVHHDSAHGTAERQQAGPDQPQKDAEGLSKSSSSNETGGEIGKGREDEVEVQNSSKGGSRTQRGDSKVQATGEQKEQRGTMGDDERREMTRINTSSSEGGSMKIGNGRDRWRRGVDRLTRKASTDLQQSAQTAESASMQALQARQTPGVQDTPAGHWAPQEEAVSLTHGSTSDSQVDASDETEGDVLQGGGHEHRRGGHNRGWPRAASSEALPQRSQSAKQHAVPLSERADVDTLAAPGARAVPASALPQHQQLKGTADGPSIGRQPASTQSKQQPTRDAEQSRSRESDPIGASSSRFSSDGSAETRQQADAEAREAEVGESTMDKQTSQLIQEPSGAEGGRRYSRLSPQPHQDGNGPPKTSKLFPLGAVCSSVYDNYEYDDEYDGYVDSDNDE